MSGERMAVPAVPVTQRVSVKIEEIQKAQAALRIEVECIVKVLCPEAMHDNKTKVEEAAKDPKEQGWFARAGYELRAVLRFEQSTTSMLNRLRHAIEPQSEVMESQRAAEALSSGSKAND